MTECDGIRLIQYKGRIYGPGFVPVIINIQPMTDLYLFLGLSKERAKHGTV